MKITKGRLREIIREELQRPDTARKVSIITESGVVLALDPGQVLVATDKNGEEVQIKASDIVKVL